MKSYNFLILIVLLAVLLAACNGQTQNNESEIQLEIIDYLDLSPIPR